MAGALILNAGTASPITLPIASVSMQPPRQVGAVSNAYLGGERSSLQREMQLHQYVTTPIMLTVALSVRSLTALGAQIPVTGVLFQGGIITCAMTVSWEAVAGTVGDDGWPLVTMRLAVREV